jgi:hypothetical protein
MCVGGRGVNERRWNFWEQYIKAGEARAWERHRRSRKGECKKGAGRAGSSSSPRRVQPSTVTSCRQHSIGSDKGGAGVNLASPGRQLPVLEATMVAGEKSGVGQLGGIRIRVCGAKCKRSARCMLGGRVFVRGRRQLRLTSVLMDGACMPARSSLP